MAYAKRYPGGFVDKPSLTTAIDSTFLNAVETALLELLSTDGSVDGQALQWIAAQSKFGPALLLNKNIDAAAAIDKSKLNLAGTLTNADVSGAAAIDRSKLNFGAGLGNSDIAATAAIAGSKLNLIPATTLNASPTNGEVGVLTDSTSAPTYAWAFVWNASAAKWLFIGGAPAESHVDTSENVTSVTYVDLATVGPQFTLPRAGDYILHFGAKIQFASATNNTMFVTPKLGAAATADADGATILNNGITGGMFATISRTRKATGLAASAVIKLQYRQSTAAAQAIQDRWLTVLPVSVT